MGQTTADHQRVAIDVLGPLEVRRDGIRVALGRPQQRAVLARLAMSVGQVVSTSRLVDTVWGEHPTPGAPSTLQTHVSHLRRILEPDRPPGAAATVLVTRGNGYLLDLPEVAVDANRFETLLQPAFAAATNNPDVTLRLVDEALRLWRGDVLADLAEYAFVAPYASRLEGLRVTALEAHIRALLDLGHDARALAEADSLAMAHPLREAAHEHRILALYRTGRQADALAAYRAVWALLDEELGIEPGPGLKQLQARMLAHDPSLLASRPDSATVGASATTDSNGPTTPPPTGAGVASRLGGPAVEEPSAVAGPRVGPAPASAPSRTAARPTLRRTRLRHPFRLAAAGAGAVAVVAALLARPSDPLPTRLSANTIAAIDLSGRVISSVDVGTAPSALALSDGALWVANESDDTVMRIDPDEMRVTDRVDVGQAPDSLVTAGDDIWVANYGSGTVSRISTSTGRVTQNLKVGTNPAALAVSAQALWVANSGDNTVQRIELPTGLPGPVVGVGDGPDGLLVDGSSLWVANGRDGTVSHLDARTGAERSSPVRVGSGPKSLVRLGAEVWVADELSQSVTRIDVASSRTRPVYVADGPTALAVRDGDVWVAERYAGSLAKIDPTSEQTSRVAAGPEPRAALASGERLWVASGAAGGAAAHRGGTLTVAAVDLPGSLNDPGGQGQFEGVDPALVYDVTTFQAERPVYEGLVAARYSPLGPQTIVPSLAVRIPQPSDGGRTYTFQLRTGIRYSTGATLRASDLRRGMQRVASAFGGATGLYGRLVGVPACVQRPATCDLSAGVETDDVTGRVTFHLTAPDPDFLAKLSILVFPVPAGFRPGVTGPTPGTGPYAIAEYRRGAAFVLRRNPFFTARSVPASPDGYPDEIRWLHVPDLRALSAAVTSGHADLGTLTPLRNRAGASAIIADLQVTDPARLHAQPALATYFIALNSAVAPFHNVLARRALSYAVDRRVLAELAGGPLVAAPSCQLLPPGFPAYRPYCPYTTGTPDGGYHGPDLQRARALVRQSGTIGASVTVVMMVDDPGPPFLGYVAEVLRSLGYRVTERRLPHTQASAEYLYSESSHVQVEAGGWIPDYPGPSTFYDAIARCHPIANPTGFCDPELDRRAGTALTLQVTDPGAALREWTALDHDIATRAPAVFGLSLVSWWLTSKRVGDYQSSPYLGGPLLTQLWVR